MEHLQEARVRKELCVKLQPDRRVGFPNLVSKPLDRVRTRFYVPLCLQRFPKEVKIQWGVVIKYQQLQHVTSCTSRDSARSRQLISDRLRSPKRPAVDFQRGNAIPDSQLVSTV